jgi:hypothetical protein
MAVAVRRMVCLASRVIVARSGDIVGRRRFIVLRVWDASLRLVLVIRKELEARIIIYEALIKRIKIRLARKVRVTVNIRLIFLHSSVFLSRS